MCVCVRVCVCVNISNNGLGSQVFKMLKNVMQVDIDEVYMSTKFGGHDFFGFGDIAIFQIWPNFPFGPWGSKNKTVSKNLCKCRLV